LSLPPETLLRLLARNTIDAIGDATNPPIQVPSIAGAPAMIPSATRYEILGFSFAIGATMARPSVVL
jgi:hypothetical protein